jgi:hypothetical protein
MRFVMRAILQILAASLIATVIAAAPAIAMPDKGPITRDGHFGVSDDAQASSNSSYGHYAPSSQPRATLPGAPAWPVDPKPVEFVDTRPAPTHDGLPWDAIVIALAGAGVALGCAGVIVGMRRRSRRPRVAA